MAAPYAPAMRYCPIPVMLPGTVPISVRVAIVPPVPVSAPILVAVLCVLLVSVTILISINGTLAVAFRLSIVCLGSDRWLLSLFSSLWRGNEFRFHCRLQAPLGFGLRLLLLGFPLLAFQPVALFIAIRKPLADAFRLSVMCLGSECWLLSLFPSLLCGNEFRFRCRLQAPLGCGLRVLLLGFRLRRCIGTAGFLEMRPLFVGLVRFFSRRFLGWLLFSEGSVHLKPFFKRRCCLNRDWCMDRKYSQGQHRRCNCGDIFFAM